MFKIDAKCKPMFTSIVKKASSLAFDCQKWVVDNLKGFKFEDMVKFMCLIDGMMFPGGAQRCKAFSGLFCLFPFIYKGKTYNKCTTDDSAMPRAWCATKVDENRNMVAGNWNTCVDPSCGIGNGMFPGNGTTGGNGMGGKNLNDLKNPEDGGHVEIYGSDRLKMPQCFEFVQASIGNSPEDGVTKTDKEIMNICEALQLLVLNKKLYKVEMHFNRNNYVKMETRILVDCDEC